jgi:hypothetical protein
VHIHTHNQTLAHIGFQSVENLLCPFLKHDNQSRWQIGGRALSMEQDNKVIGLWRDRDATSPAQFPPIDATEDGGRYTDQYDAPLPGRWRKPLAIALCGGSALAWVAAWSWSNWSRWTTAEARLSEVLTGIAQAATPLALVGIIWLLLQRSSQAEADRFARTTREMQKESQRLEALLAFVSARIDASRRDLADQSEALLTLGDEAALRMANVSESMRKEVDTISGHAQALKGTAAAARGDVAVLMSHLPKTQVQMRQIARSLEEAGDTAQGSAARLAVELDRLGATSLEAEALAQRAAGTLGMQVSTILDSSAQLCDALADAEERLDVVGTAKSEVMAVRVTKIREELDAIGTQFATHSEASESFSARIGKELGVLESRFRALGESAGDVIARNANALHDLEERSQRVSTQFQDQGSKADEMAVRLSSLMERLGEAGAKMDQDMPQAFARLESSASRALASVNDALPTMSSIAETAHGALAQIIEARSLIEQQGEQLASLGSSAAASLEQSQADASSLNQLIEDALGRAKQLSGATTQEVVAALTALRSSVEDTVRRAERDFAAIVPGAADALGKESAKVMAQQLDALTADKIELIAATGERAAALARQSSQHLANQLKQILDASAALEKRVEDVRATHDDENRDGFARKTALLIESLNSQSIDITKMFSNDVTDVAWAAYLKGDRSIFARRAVKLIDQSEAREIARHYQEDGEFHAQVNRYIHDYEAMLRTVMSTRDGTPLSVALLSSDTGKLYVALAQAIDRLRN